MRYPSILIVGIAQVLGLLLALAGCSRPPAQLPPGVPSVSVSYPVQRDVTDYADFTARNEHLRERYGQDEVKTWLWEVWNEPDIPYWKGTREEYFRLYDVSVEAVQRARIDAEIAKWDGKPLQQRAPRANNSVETAGRGRPARTQAARPLAAGRDWLNCQLPGRGRRVGLLSS